MRLVNSWTKKDTNRHHMMFEIDVDIDQSQRWGFTGTIARASNWHAKTRMKLRGEESFQDAPERIPNDWECWEIQCQNYPDFGGTHVWFYIWQHTRKMKVVIEDFDERCTLTEAGIAKYLIELEMKAQYELGRDDCYHAIKRNFEERTGMDLDEAVKMLSTPVDLNLQ